MSERCPTKSYITNYQKLLPPTSRTQLLRQRLRNLAHAHAYLLMKVEFVVFRISLRLLLRIYHLCLHTTAVLFPPPLLNTWIYFVSESLSNQDPVVLDTIAAIVHWHIIYIPLRSCESLI